MSVGNFCFRWSCFADPEKISKLGKRSTRAGVELETHAYRAVALPLSSCEHCFLSLLFRDVWFLAFREPCFCFAYTRVFAECTFRDRLFYLFWMRCFGLDYAWDQQVQFHVEKEIFYLEWDKPCANLGSGGLRKPWTLFIVLLCKSNKHLVCLKLAIFCS